MAGGGGGGGGKEKGSKGGSGVPDTQATTDETSGATAGHTPEEGTEGVRSALDSTSERPALFHRSEENRFGVGALNCY